MSVNDGEKVNAAVSNTSWVSKQDTTGNEVTGIIDLNNTTDVNSGVQIPNTQEKINDNTDRIAVNETDIAQNVADIALNTADVADVRTTQGTSDGDTDMGAYTGGILTDNQPVKTNVQELSDAIEAIPAGLTYLGTWNADTNTPSLSDSPGAAASGEYYVVSVAGSTSLDGITDWALGDWAIVSSTGVWQKVDNSEAISDTDDVPEGSTNLYYTDTRADARIAAASIDDLGDVDTTTDTPNVNEALVWDGVNWVPGQATGGGSGLKNFYSSANADLEVDVIGDTDWNTFDDGAVSEPVDGTGTAATNVSLSLSSGGASVSLSNNLTDDSFSSISNNTNWKAQVFQTTAAGDIATVRLKIEKTGAGATGTIKALIRDVSASEPGSTTHATSNTIDIGALSTAVHVLDFTFPTPYSASNGEDLAAVLDISGALGFNFNIKVDTGNSYANGGAYTSTDSGSTWVGIFDLYFDILTAAGSGVVLDQDKSLTVTKAAADSQGEGISVDGVVDLLYRDGVAYGSVGLSTDGNYTGTMGVWMYDVSNSTLINILEADNLIPAGFFGKYKFSFIVPTGCEDLRFIMMETDTNTTGYVVTLDVLRVGPDTLNVEIPLVDETNSEGLIPFVYAGGGGSKGTTTIDALYTRIVGDRMQIFGYYLQSGAGSNGTGDLTVDLAGIGTIDTNKFEVSVNRRASTCGYGRVVTGATQVDMTVYAADDSTLTFAFGTSGSDSDVQTFFSSASAAMSFEVDIPLVGLGNNTTRGLAKNAQLYRLSAIRNTSSQTISSASITTLIYNEVFSVTGGDASDFNTTTGVWTCPKTSYYDINANGLLDNLTANETVSIRLTIAGNTRGYEQKEYVGGGGTFNLVRHGVYIEKGDTLSISSDSAADTSYTFVNNTGVFFDITEKPFSQTAIVAQNKTALIRDEKSSSTNGGTFTSLAWQIRDLNTLDDRFNLIKTFSSNEFEVRAPFAGVIKWKCPAVQVNNHASRLYNVTDAAEEQAGSSGTTGVTESMDNWSYGQARVAISEDTTYRIEHRCSDTKASIGFGNNSGISSTEVYTQVEVIKDGE